MKDTTKKILGIGQDTEYGRVVKIERDGVTFKRHKGQKGKRVVYTLAEVELMVLSTRKG